ncbi:MAG: Gfo/Idh/MocA family oxidoreductase, partial [Chthonomonadaceae bacterium]|nr:Gfo/Idh/MocA family oxidoreductase [Chthonomonadaceae bacterium]
MSNALKIGIVGKRGLSFLSGLRSLAGVEVLAFCEQNPQTLQTEADKHGIPQRFAEYTAMLDKVDAVVVATPMPLHVPQSVLALGAGKHVLSEVTAAVSIDECWQLLDAVKSSGKTYFFAENYCFLEPNVLIGELVKKGLFGDLYFGEGEYLHEVRALHHDAL